MIGRLRTWLRVVLPTEWAIVVFFAVLTCVYGLAAIRSTLGDESLSSFRELFIPVVAIFYAAFRAMYFHPVENQPYGRWLSESTWTYPEPLPLGPLTLVWQDAVIIAVLTAFFPREYSALWSVTIFLLAYSLLLAYTHWKAGLDWVAFAVAVLTGVFALLSRGEMARLLVAAIMYGVVHTGTQQMLRAFPISRELSEWLTLSPESNDRSACVGWPVPPPRRARWTWSIGPRQAAGLAFCVGWLLFCAAYHFRELPESERFLAGAYAYTLFAAVVGRLWIYLWGYAPPISLIGRIATRRLVIPGYDAALVAPLMTAIVGCVLPSALSFLNIHPAVAFPIGASAVTWLALALPPRREDWQLTGHHRIAFRFLANRISQSDSNRKSSRLS